MVIFSKLSQKTCLLFSRIHLYKWWQVPQAAREMIIYWAKQARKRVIRRRPDQFNLLFKCMFFVLFCPFFSLEFVCPKWPEVIQICCESWLFETIIFCCSPTVAKLDMISDMEQDHPLSTGLQLRRKRGGRGGRVQMRFNKMIEEQL